MPLRIEITLIDQKKYYCSRINCQIRHCLSTPSFFSGIFQPILAHVRLFEVKVLNRTRQDVIQILGTYLVTVSFLLYTCTCDTGI